MKNIFIKPVRFTNEFNDLERYDFEISDTPKKGFEELKSLTDVFIRDFSVGYDERTTKMLQRKHQILDLYTINNDDVTKKTQGSKFTMGAYRGYYRIKTYLNGKLIANGRGMFNRKVDTLINNIRNKADK